MASSPPASDDLEALRRFFALAPFMVDLGVVPVATTPGRVHTLLALAPRHLQHTGQAHAGIISTLADHSMGAAAQTLAPAGRWAITAELKTSLLRPGRGLRLVCEAWVLKPGRSLSFTEAEVYAETDDGPRTLVAKASATMAFVPAADTPPAVF
jgi:uncharacterized protein (TIGR00369 family)